MAYNSLYILLDSICQHLVEDFCINGHKRYWSAAYLCTALSGFHVRVTLALHNDIENDTSSPIFWKKLQIIGVNSSLNVYQKFPVKPPGPGNFF